MRQYNRRVMKNIAIIASAIMIISTMTSLSSVAVPANSGTLNANLSENQTYLGARTNVACEQNLTATVNSGPYVGHMDVLISFSLRNTSRLSQYLNEVSDTHSSYYHKYITREEFTQNFSVPDKLYAEAVNYFSGYAGITVKTFSDRISLKIEGSSAEIGHIFGTSIVYNGNHTLFEPASFPTLPEVLASQITQISGLNNARVATVSPLYTEGALSSNLSLSPQKGYPKPILSSSGVQYIYGSDLQVAYDEQALFNTTFPTNQVVATILWAGNSSSGQHVAPFDPADIYNYYNATIPSGEPHSKIYGVPLDHAVSPGPSADEDNTGAYVENTLDLEMVGSLAPGSSIYNVYGPEPTESCLNSAFACILNPGSRYSDLNNVSVISNSWGTPEFNDTAWYEYLQEAQARGISVLASSGDSGDNPSSPEYEANPNSSTDFLDFPAAMAYNDFGITSVGGTTLTLNSNLQIASQVAWYETVEESLLGLFKIGEPVGSTGGISSVFPETSWERNTEANTVISGNHLGVPDLGAIANNTLICISVKGQMGLCDVAGTSIASPTEAGIVAEIDAVLNKFNQSNLGYLNPLIFNMANTQMETHVSSVSFASASQYDSTLPLLPLCNVHSGGNYEYKALSGYNLVTGWGSINAYNLTIFLLDRNFNDEPNAVSALNVTANLTSTAGYSAYKSQKTEGFAFEQTYLLADQLDAPIYQVVSIASFTDESNGSVMVNLSLRSHFPYTFSRAHGYVTNTSQITFYSGSSVIPTSSFVTNFANNSNTFKSALTLMYLNHRVNLNVPGAAYIIGGVNYSYEPDGFDASGLPSLISSNNATLSPGFGFKSLYPDGNVTFSSHTSGTIILTQEEMGQSTFESTVTSVFNDSSNHINSNVNWKRIRGIWTFSAQSGDNNLAIHAYIPSYDVVFQESGMNNKWMMKIESGFSGTSEGSRINLYLVNGTYTMNFTSHSRIAVPGDYSFNVSGMVNEIFSVEFQSASNRTLLRQLSGINPIKNTVLNSKHIELGILNDSSGSGFYSSAMDINTQIVFLIIANEPYVYAINAMNNEPVSKVFMGENSRPQYVSYDNATSEILVYSAGTGNISIINPLTYVIVKNVTVNKFKGENSTIEAVSGTENVVLFNNVSGFVLANLTSGDISNINIAESIFDQATPYFYADTSSIYFINSARDYLDIYNDKTGKVNNLTFQAGFKPETLVYSGYDKLLYISGRSGNQFPLMVYNLTDGIIIRGPTLNNPVISSTYDNLSGLTYLSTSGILQEIYILSPLNLSVQGSAPFVIIPSTNQHFSGMNFDWKTQDLTVDAGYAGLYTYTVQQFYRLTLNESGLPSDTAWNYTITGFHLSGSTKQTMVDLEIHNGTFNLSGNSVLSNFVLYPYLYEFIINGNPKLLNVRFVFAYPVLFKERGLPAGVQWYVNITNIKPSGGIDDNYYTAMVPNGTYEYSLSTSLKIFSPVNHTSSMHIAGHNLSVIATFYLVTFEISVRESGLYNNTEWYVVNGTGFSYSSDSTQIDLHLPNGTYFYNITTVSGYYTLISSFSFTVSGKNKTVSLEFFHYAYVVGNVVPKNAIITISGNSYKSTEGNVNISLRAGYYTLKITENGYDYYYKDFSVRPGQVENIGNITLKKIPDLTPTFYYAFYAAIAVALAAMILVGVYFAIKRKD